MLNSPFWIYVLPLMLFLSHPTFGSNIRAATNLTTCDINTAICSTQMSIAATLSAPTDYLSLRTLDNTDFKIYFENITLNFKVHSALNQTVVDGGPVEEKVMSCGSDKNPNLCDWHKGRFDPNIKYKTFKRFYYDTDKQGCKINHGGAYTCYFYWLYGSVEYTGYYGFSYQLDSLGFIYKKKSYIVRQHETIQLPGFSLTFVTGQAMTFPLDIPIILVNPYNSHTFIKKRGDVNLPNEYEGTKAGWWKPSTPNQNPSDLAWNHLPPDPIYMADHLKICYLATFPDFLEIPFSMSCPGDPANWGQELTNEVIEGYRTTRDAGKNIVYAANGIRDTTLVEINGIIAQLCSSYPVICICSSLNPLTCLDVEGIIKIATPGFGGFRLVHLRNQRIYSQTSCYRPIFSITQVPNLVDIQISGSNIIPKIDISFCKPSANLDYKKDILYVKTNCTFLPCIVNSDTGFSFNFTANTKETRVELESTWKWVELGCLRSFERFYKNQAQDVSEEVGNPIGTVIDHGAVPGDGSGDSIFDSIWGAISGVAGGVWNFAKAPFVFLWDFITSPLDSIKNLFNGLVSNLLFWFLMIFGGLISICVNGFLVTIVSEFVAWQVYVNSTATAGLMALAGCLIGSKILETIWSSRKLFQSTEAAATTPLLTK